MGQDDNKSIAKQNQNHEPQGQYPGAVPAPESPIDLSGIDGIIKTAIFALMQRIETLELKCASIPISRPVVMPAKENHNTDFVAGIY